MNGTLSRKLNKVLETRIDNPEILEALNNLSTFYGKNSLSARRNLRSQIEKRGIEINEEFMDAFMMVQKQLDSVKENLSEMKNSWDEMATRLQKTKEISGKLIQQAEKMNEERINIEKHRDICERFLNRFQLTADELQTLKAQEIVPSFFQTLKRVQQIHNDCKLLLRTQHQKAGLEIMDMMSLHQENAYKKLYRWVRSQSRTFSENSPVISDLVRQSILALKDRPILLSYCLDEVANTRSATIAKGFIIALTQGGPNGIPRPIEIQTHDPPRYIGDMLAWIHQNIASETELINSLVHDPHFVIQTGNTSDDVGSINIGRVVDTTLDGVIRPFRSRLSQVLGSHPNVVVVYKLSNILDFYSRTIGKIVGRKSQVVTSLNECRQESLKVFYDLLKEYGDHLQRSPPTAPPNLAPPPEVYDAVNRLVDIMSIFETSLVPIDEREAEFKPVLSAVLEPLINACTLSGTPLGLSDVAVYLINCLHVMQTALSSYDFTANRVETIGAHIKIHMKTLVKEQTDLIFSNCKMANTLGILGTYDSVIPMPQIPGLNEKSIAEAAHSFELLLLDPSALLMPQCDRLLNSQLRTYARSKVSQLIYESYLFLYNTIMDPKNNYPDPKSLFIYTPDQVKTMVDTF